MKILKVSLSCGLVERIFADGYEARGGMRVRGGLPPGAKLEQAMIQTDPFSKQDALVLYFTTEGDGVEELCPSLLRVEPE